MYVGAETGKVCLNSQFIYYQPYWDETGRFKFEKHIMFSKKHRILLE